RAAGVVRGVVGEMPAVKAVQIGRGGLARLHGSGVHHRVAQPEGGPLEAVAARLVERHELPLLVRGAGGGAELRPDHAGDLAEGRVAGGVRASTRTMSHPGWAGTSSGNTLPAGCLKIAALVFDGPSQKLGKSSGATDTLRFS